MVEIPLHLPELGQDVVIEKSWAVVLYNDDVNTFDWVIDCLVNYCGHNEIQAEQCAWFVHYKGKYPVKHGSLEDLIPICSALCDKGLAAKLEQ
ncbi:MAG: ATP-dependent Clp protease adaptor ClpS [Sphingomonadales bacterium]|jgi:ATP-dependent Clp protease adaptor protein ClpS